MDNDRTYISSKTEIDALIMRINKTRRIQLSLVSGLLIAGMVLMAVLTFLVIRSDHHIENQEHKIACTIIKIEVYNHLRGAPPIPRSCVP